MTLSRVACSLALACLSLSSFVTAKPRACKAGPGGVDGCWTHDGCIMASKGILTRVTTSMNLFESANGPEGPWSYKGNALRSPNTKYWAPEIANMGNGQYVMLYSDASFGTQNSAIRYAVSSTLEAGSWVEQGGVVLQSHPHDPYNAIDGALFRHGGNWFMVFGSFFAGIFVVQMSGDGVQVAGKPQNVVGGFPHGNPVEAGYVVHEAGYFWLFFSEGSCCGYDKSHLTHGQEYKIRVCKSTNPMGPYTDSRGKSCLSAGGDVVLASSGNNFYGPGGQSFFKDGGQWIMHYQYGE